MELESSTPVHSTEGTRSNVQQVLQRIQKLPINGEGGKFERLKEVNACFVCFGIPGTFLDGLLGVVLLVVAQPPQPAPFLGVVLQVGAQRPQPRWL